MSPLLPREHGAYAELLFPLATGLAWAGPSAGAVAFAVAALAFFLLHEPVAIMTGRRGIRLRDSRSEDARRWAVSYAVVGAAAGVTAWVLVPAARVAALVPAVLSAVLVAVMVAGREKTLAAELLVVLVFAATLFPVAVANGAPRWFALGASGVWFVGFALGTVTVHAIKARHKQVSRGRWTIHGAPALAGLAILAALLAMTEAEVPAVIPAAVLPGAAVALVASLGRIHPRHLREVGWSLVGAHVLTLALLLSV